MSVTRFHSLSVYPTFNPAPLFLAEVPPPVDEVYLTESQMPVPGIPPLVPQQISESETAHHSLYDPLDNFGAAVWAESHPNAHSTYPSPEETVLSISVSTAFHPNAHPHLQPPDTVLVSIESVLFYVHSEIILKTCKCAFVDFLGRPLDDPEFRHVAVPIDLPSAELNIIIHLLYGTSPAAHSPTFEELEKAIDSMPLYSVIPSKYIVPTSPLYTLLLSIAPLRPMDTYILAAYHKLHDLAVASSAHLLSYSPKNISDAQAERMGAIYLKKLVDLHLTRLNALKTVLLTPPLPHPPTRRCGIMEQSKLTRAWALASAYIVWESRLDFSTYDLQSSLNPLLEDLECLSCKASLQHRITDIIIRWTSVERTI